MQMGALITWSKDLEICELVDKQHKRLVDLLNEFYDGYLTKMEANDLLDILRELKRYSIYHFRTEELLFEFADDPNIFQKHKVEHDYFIKKVSEFSFKFFYDPEKLDKEVMDFLKNWTLHHISQIDKQYKTLCDKLSQQDLNLLMEKIEQNSSGGVIDDLSQF